MTLSVRVTGTGPLKQALTEAKDGDKMLRSGITAGALIVQNQARRDVHQVSGKLHDSTGTTVTGSGWHIEAHIGPRPGFGGPRVSASGAKGLRNNPTRRVNKSDPRDYAARYQYGFHGTDSRGRKYNQSPNRYLIEAVTENLELIGRTIAARIEAMLRFR